MSSLSLRETLVFCPLPLPSPEWISWFILSLLFILLKCFTHFHWLSELLEIQKIMVDRGLIWFCHSLCLNRAVPKFMKRIKVPDYKDRNVFGVPLQVNVQRTGQPLPQSIQQAMRYLRNHCLDQVGFAVVSSHTHAAPKAQPSINCYCSWIRLKKVDSKQDKIDN